MNLSIHTVHGGSIFGNFSGVTGIVLGPLRAEGGFGKIYPAVRIQGKRVTDRLVVKVFHAGANGDRCYETAKKLQTKLNERIAIQIAGQRRPLKEVSVLQGSPQFCFEGELEGAPVKGYAMLDLDKLGYVSFDSITESDDPVLRAEYNNLEIGAKLKIAHSLVSGLSVLASLYYVHADLNPPNLFIHLKTHQAALIDFDGGAIMDGPNEAPGTLGRITDAEWLAPELLAQIAAGTPLETIRVNLLTEFWSVAVAVHYLLFLRGPYFFLQLLSKKAILDYLSRYKWYEAGPNHPSIDATKLSLHADYKEFVALLPSILMDKFRTAFNAGVTQTALRPSTVQWESSLATVISSKPTILEFSCSPRRPVEGEPFQLNWSVRGEWETLLQGQDVTGEQELEMRLDEPTDVVLEARGIGGAVETRTLRIAVLQYPRILTFEAATSDIGEGQMVRLSWDARHHEQLWLNGEALPPNTTSKLVHPIGPYSEYVLSSKNTIGEAVSHKVAIKVHKPPLLHRFWTDHRALTSQDTLNIFWKADRAEEVELRFKRLSGHQYVETMDLVPAKAGKFAIRLDSSCDITCIARSKFGESELGPLRVDVVPVPKLEFLVQEVGTLPEARILVEGIDLAAHRISFGTTPVNGNFPASPPTAYGEFAERKWRNATAYFLFSFCLAVVCGVVGYFIAIHR